MACGWLVLCMGIPVPPLQTGLARAIGMFMKIRPFIEPGYLPSLTHRPGLHPEDSVYQAINLFSKAKDCLELPVFESGKYLGKVTLPRLTQELLSIHRKEKHDRFRQQQFISSQLTKLKYLLEKNGTAHTHQEMTALVASLMDTLH